MVNASVYKGESRAIPRWTIVLMLAIITVVIAGTLLFKEPGMHSIADPPWILKLPYQFRPLTVVLSLLALFGLFQFARRRSPVEWGVVTLLALGYLKQSQWALTGYEIRNIYIGGTVFGGWIFGLFFSHALDAHLKRAPDPTRDDVLGEAGATGAFVAVYMSALGSKIIATGFDWADGGKLLSTIVSRHKFMHSPGLLDHYLQWLLDHPGLASLFGVATMCIQAGMILYFVSPRWRMIMGALVFSFHLNALMLMGVRYIESMVLAAVFSYPWPKILRRLRGGSWNGAGNGEDAPIVEETAALQPVVRSAGRWVATIGAVTFLLWSAIHWDDTQSLFVERESARNSSSHDNVAKGNGPGPGPGVPPVNGSAPTKAAMPPGTP